MGVRPMACDGGSGPAGLGRLRSMAVGLALGLASLAVPGCRPPEQQAALEVAKADQLLAENNGYGAFVALGRATRLDANNVDAWLKLGLLQLRAGDATAADQSFQRAQELAPDNIAALDNLVILSIRGGDLDRAKRYMDALLVLQPDDPAGLLAQGAIALRERRLPDALAASERLVKDYTDISEGFLLRARVLTALGRPREATDLLEQWLATHVGNGGAKNVLLLLLERYREDGNVGGIRSVARRLHDLAPDEPRYALEVARADVAEGHRDRADGIVRALLRAHPRTPAVTRAVLAFWRDTLPPGEARARALALAGGASVPTKVAIANSLVDVGLAADALAVVMPLVGSEVTAGTVDARAAQVRALAAIGDVREARRRADQVLAFDGGVVAVLMVRAQLFLAARAYDAALADAQLAQNSDADNEAAAGLIARIYAAQGNSALAQQAYALAVQRFPDSFGMLSAYLDWLNAAGRRRDAVQAAGSYARQHRRSAPAWRRYADLCRAEQDPCLAEAQAALAGA